MTSLQLRSELDKSINLYFATVFFLFLLSFSFSFISIFRYPLLLFLGTSRSQQYIANVASVASGIAQLFLARVPKN